MMKARDVIKATELAFREKALGRTQMPPKSYLFFRQHNGDLRTMPSYFEGLDISGVKVVNVHPANPKRHGLPAVMATIVLIDPKTGAPLAIMGGSWITAMRTGASGAIATKYLGRPDSRVLALVGAGVQASTQLECIAAVLPHLEEVRVWSRPSETVTKFLRATRRRYKLRFVACETVKACIQGADVISTQTPVEAPLVESEWVSLGTHINAIGADAPGKQELDPALLKRAKIVVDDMEQAIHSGEVNVPLSRGLLAREDIYGELGEVIIGAKPGRSSEEEITIFDSTGLSLQDVSVAVSGYRKAKRAKVGRWITL